MIYSLNNISAFLRSRDYNRSLLEKMSWISSIMGSPSNQPEPSGAEMVRIGIFNDFKWTYAVHYLESYIYCLCTTR